MPATCTGSQPAPRVASLNTHNYQSGLRCEFPHGNVEGETEAKREKPSACGHTGDGQGQHAEQPRATHRTWPTLPPGVVLEGPGSWMAQGGCWWSPGQLLSASGGHVRVRALSSVRSPLSGPQFPYLYSQAYPGEPPTDTCRDQIRSHSVHRRTDTQPCGACGGSTVSRGDQQATQQKQPENPPSPRVKEVSQSQCDHRPHSWDTHIRRETFFNSSFLNCLKKIIYTSTYINFWGLGI